MKALVQTEPLDNIIYGVEAYDEDNVFRKGTLVDFVTVPELAAYLRSKYTMRLIGGEVIAEEDKSFLYCRVDEAQSQLNKSRVNAKYEMVLKKVLSEGRPITDVTTDMQIAKQIASELEQRLDVLQKEYDGKVAAINKALRKKALAEHSADKLCAVVAIMKDENEYLEEWIRHYLRLGFDHIYIYDNMSRIPLQDTLNGISGIDKNKVTIKLQCKHPKFSTQQWVYTKCLKTVGQGYRWLYYVDADEYLELNGKTVQEFLNAFDSNHDIGYINLRWVTYNAGGQVTKTAGTLIERFTELSPYVYDVNVGKGFVRTCLTDGVSMHGAAMKYGAVRVNSVGKRDDYKRLKSPENDIGRIEADAVAHTKHYYTKSLQEFIENKIMRGAADALYNKSGSDFIRHNPEMEKDVTAEMFALTQKYQGGSDD